MNKLSLLHTTTSCTESYNYDNSKPMSTEPKHSDR
jgi:hypothetical protein